MFNQLLSNLRKRGFEKMTQIIVFVKVNYTEGMRYVADISKCNVISS